MQAGVPTVVGTISGATYTVDFDAEPIQTWSITANITINEPATDGEYGAQLVYITVDGTDRTITLGSADVVGIGSIATGSLTLAASTEYEMTVTRSSDTKTYVSFVKVGA